MLAKAAVDFEHPATGDRHCRDCKHYLMYGRCQIVAGVIHPQDWCNQWKGKKMKMEKAADKAVPSHEIDHMRVMKAENGGHIIEHHFKMKPSKTPAFIETPEPEKHVFGEGEGMEAHEHIAEHMHMPMQTGDQEEEEEKGEPI